ncbi:MAG TPA: hypothetical protein VJX23_02950 [Candidatus Binataceae bacterium]|nr:hypothetical protein [Candidatus Binataceae bacterium]
MSQVEVIVTGTIAAAQQVLAITQTADTLPAMTVGVVLPATLIASVTGGVAPYTYSFDQDTDGSKGLIQKSAADLVALGLTPAEDGSGNISISGTPLAAAAVAFGVIATDSAGTQVSTTIKGAAAATTAAARMIGG